VIREPMERLWGRVIRSVGDYHTVFVESGEVLCRARGRLKQRGAVVTGDLVEISLSGKGQGVIEEVAPRSTYLFRPTVANVDTAVVVMALAKPDPVLELADRLLAIAEREKLRAILVFTKADLVEPSQAQSITAPYVAAGYPIFVTSAKTSDGIAALRDELSSRVSILAGPSGVGKSSLLNALIPGAELQTGELSEKVNRGRHTTRHVSLLRIGERGWIADSPGFSTLSFGTMDPRALPGLFPDLAALAVDCRFNGCLHQSEPGCAVKRAVEDGQLDAGRYRRYLRILQEVTEAFERRY